MDGTVTKEVPVWFTSGRFFDAEKNFEGRRAYTVQRGIFEFIKSGRVLPDEFGDQDSFENHFVERMVRVPVYSGSSIQATEEERKAGYADVPLVWNLADLWDAVNAYTNVDRPHGPGRRYDEHFSFEVKMLRPDWKCIRSLLSNRARFNQEEGLSPWEKRLKAKEQEFLKNLRGMSKEELRESYRRLSFMDQEFLWFCSSINPGEVFQIAEEDRDLLHEVTDNELYEMWGNGRAGFDYVVNWTYFELNQAVERKVLDEAGWLECDKTLQEMLTGVINRRPGYPRSLKKYPLVLDLLKKFWAGAKIEKMADMAKTVLRII